MTEKRLQLDRIKTYSLKKRKSKVAIADFSRPHRKGASLGSFLGGLPNILAAKDLKEVATAICMARKKERPIMFALGAHVIKTGLSPIFIDLIEAGFVSSIALNGAGMVHDFEIAQVGHTSEDVEVHIRNGRFGMAEETGRFINEAIKEGANKDWGLGEAFGRMLLKAKPTHENLSIVASALKNEVSVTVHVAIGTDIFHMHPMISGADLGETSHRDFLRFCYLIAHLERGVYLNIGSAVVLPEVFLKALTLARNLGHPLRQFTTVDMDFFRQYRPSKNVVQRPTVQEGKGYQLIGHHEIMVPLLAAAIKEGSD